MGHEGWNQWFLLRDTRIFSSPDRVSAIPNWPWTPHVAENNLWTHDSPTSLFRVLRLQACATMLSLLSFTHAKPALYQPSCTSSSQPRIFLTKGLSLSPCIIQVAFQHYSCLLSAKIASMSHHGRLALFDFEEPNGSLFLQWTHSSILTQSS